MKVKEQYATSRNLDTRIHLHEKYSSNKQGFGNWIQQQYTIKENDNILELGCGNGDMWKDNYGKLPKGCELWLTDFSEGMVAEAKRTLHGYEDIHFRQVDIQSIPHQNQSMDIIIANMMLYHVPDLDAGLLEVKRVLKEEGEFYCATFGENGVMKYVCNLLSPYGARNIGNHQFTLQNGEQLLKKHFGKVEKREYKDSLNIADTKELIAYMKSLTYVQELEEIPWDEIASVLEKRKENGILHIPKEYGMFIVRKSI